MTDSPTRKRKTKKKLNWKKVATSLVVVILIVCLGMGCFFAWSVYKETDDFSAYFLGKRVRCMILMVN